MVTQLDIILLLLYFVKSYQSWRLNNSFSSNDFKIRQNVSILQLTSGCTPSKIRPLITEYLYRR